MKYFYFILYLIFLSSLQFGEAKESQKETGTLIVSFQSGCPEADINCIHFWLIDEHEEYQLFPKKEQYVDDANSLERKVVINNLPPGHYFIEFIIPNQHGIFEEVPRKEVFVGPGSIVKVDQVFRRSLNYNPHKNEIAIILPPTQARVKGDTIIIDQPIPYYLLPPEYRLVPFSVRSNLQLAGWTLYQDGVVVYSGTGSLYDFPVPQGGRYLLQPELIPGYTVSVFPSGEFSLRNELPFQAEITYQRDLGFVQLSSNFPAGEALTLSLIPDDGRLPIQVRLNSEAGKINWKSGPIPTGFYGVNFQLPEEYTPLPSTTIEVLRGQTSVINPQFIRGQNIRVQANVPDAVYTLSAEDGSGSWTGEGMQHLFTNIYPGRYTLTFSSRSPQTTAPPPPRQIVVANQDMQINAEFKRAGRLVINSNLNHFNVQLTETGGGTEQRRISEEIFNRTKTLTISEGTYRIEFYPALDARGTANMVPPQPMTVQIRPGITQTISANFERGEPEQRVDSRAEPSINQGQLTITSDVQNILFTIKDPANPDRILSFQGAQNNIPLNAGEYEIEFKNLPNYNAPAPRKVLISQGERQTIHANYELADSLLPVAGGVVIMGDPLPEERNNERSARQVEIPPFSIGKFEVTNQEYVDWLNQAIREEQIAYGTKGTGLVSDQEGNILLKTIEADRLSQIAVQRGKGAVSFQVLPGKETHPVILVSWHGANAYAQAQEGRLPTEAEWEKAAGMSVEEPLKKFKYGFSRDTIDRSWANYKPSDAPLLKTSVLSTPVGFYNGRNQLPLQISDRTQLTTNNAESPIGAYDMSGNVWEWVSDWYSDNYPRNMGVTGPSTGTKKVAKGGCYDSLAEGVRVAERIGLSPDHSDIYTGFRIAKNRQE